MARPKKEGMDYFPHDVHAFNDKKIEALRMIHGLKGYAVYFFLLEQIYQEKDFELDISDAETIQILCRKLEINQEEFEAIIHTSIKHGCFDRDEYEQRRVLTSDGIKKRSGVVIEKREKMREKYRQVKPVVSDAETGEETGEESTQSKEKKSKEKKSKDIKISVSSHVQLTQKQINTLTKKYGEQGFKQIVYILNDYKQRSGKTYESDYLAINRWVVKRYLEDLQKVARTGANRNESVIPLQRNRRDIIAESASLPY